VAIARALDAAQLMLFDEPPLPRPRTCGRRPGRDALAADKGMTMIVVTHEMGFARRFVTAWCSWTRAHRRVRPAREVLRQPGAGATQAFLSRIL